MARSRSSAELAGEEQSKELAIPVNPFNIAAGEQIEVREMNTERGISGLLLHVGGNFLIGYSASVTSSGFQRFSVAHELGHYFLPGHPEHVLVGDDPDHQLHKSRAASGAKDKYEQEADQFAVGLLMPRVQFLKAMRGHDETLGLVKRLSAAFDTSLTATAIRMVSLSREPTAMVVCGQDSVEFCVCSDSMAKLIGWEPIRRGMAIPRRTATESLWANPHQVIDADEASDQSSLPDWFGQGPQREVLEEVVGLGSYGKTLTMISMTEAYDEDEEEEDKELHSSWQPTFHRSRRK